MFKPSSIIFSGVLLFGIICCSPFKAKKQTRTIQVKKTDFLNTIQLHGYLEAANSKSIASPRIWTGMKIVYLAEDGSYVNSGDTVCIIEAAELESKFAVVEKDLEIRKTEYNKTEQDLKLQYLLLESQVKTIETSTRIKNLDSIQQQFASETEKKRIQLELEKAEIERKKLHSKLSFLRKINESELRKAKLKIEQAENDLNRIKHELTQLVLISEDEGLIQIGTNWSTDKPFGEGEAVWPNMPIVNLPDLSKLQVRMVVSETHFKRLAVDQKVRISVDANPNITMNGTIITKAPGGKPLKENSSVNQFDVFVELESTPELTPGLSVSCNVILESLPDTLVVPITSIYEEDTVSYVMLNKRNKFIKTPVEIARQSNTKAVIKGGLNENDIISLSYTEAN